MPIPSSLRCLNLPLPRAAALLAVCCALAPVPALAQAELLGDTIGNPPVAKLQALDRFGAPVPEEVLKADIEAGLAPRQFNLWAYEFDIAYAKFEIKNPNNPPGRPTDTVELRNYFGPTVDPARPIVAPTVELRPGDRLRLTLDNNLPADDPSCIGFVDVNDPHCFNSTNMHTHGFWVSPSGNSDNVLIKVNPEVEFVYEYNLPEDHPAGTFWYHPHLHGSTALQVASGMAGALIVRGDRVPVRTEDGDLEPGDIDVLLQNAEGRRYPEQIVVLQQIPYACRDAQGDIKTNDNGTWRCDPGDVGAIENYDLFGPGGIWQGSGRYVSINGQVVPTLAGDPRNPLRANEVTRWRMISAGLRESMKPAFYRARRSDIEAVRAQGYSAVTEAEHEAFIDATCDRSRKLTQFSMATDGLTRPRLQKQDDTVLHPGYRDDLLMVFPEPGVYCLIDETLAAEETVSTAAKGRELLAYVLVARGPTGGGRPADVIARNLSQGAFRALPGERNREMRDEVLAALADGFDLGHFVWHETMEGMTGLPVETVGFSFDVGPSIGTLDENNNVVKPRQYKPDRIDHELVLDTAGEWRLSSEAGGHPFHIHVNPFQVISVVDPSGVEVSGAEQIGNSPYAGLQGTWKDTIFVAQDHVITVRSRYERYIGDFVLHCHILDHEDLGMMQNVRIVLPGAGGGHGGH
ncbi:MAG: multicopper oxidase family protein [Rhodobacter sp.]|nr:multicopper oxidase family protein [Rhodobacter sp.]